MLLGLMRCSAGVPEVATWRERKMKRKINPILAVRFLIKTFMCNKYGSWHNDSEVFSESTASCHLLLSDVICNITQR